MHNFRERAAIWVGALVVLAGVVVPAAVAAQAAGSARPSVSSARDGVLAASDTASSVTTAPASGIDVSNLNAITSWPEVEEQGNKFTGVLLTEGNFFENSDFAAQVSGATTAGMYVTPYVFGFPYGAYTADPPNGT